MILALILALSFESHAAFEGSSIYIAWMLPQQNANSISGHISDDQHRPVSNLRIELLNEVDSVIQTVRTDGSGLYVFRKLSDGTFQVRVLTDGTNYVSQSKRVEVVRPLGFGGIFEQADFVLRIRESTINTTSPGVVFVQEIPDAARTQYQKALESLKKSGQSKEAHAALKSAIDIFPRYFDALDLLGTEYVKEEQYEAAIPILSTAVEVNPRGQGSWYALGVAQYHLKQTPAALEALRRCVSLNPTSINSQLWLGIVLRQAGKLDEAESALKKADTLAESKLPEPHWQLALLFNQLKRFNEAADQLEIFLKVAPDARDATLIRKLIKKLREQT